MTAWEPRLAGHSLPTINQNGDIDGFVYHLPGTAQQGLAAPMTDERLEEIRRTIPETYRGPWVYRPSDEGDWWVEYPSDNPQAGHVATVPDYGENLAFFIAKARTAVPELIDEVMRLQAELAAERGESR
ncbi:hypothetical protein ACFYMO_03650 [Streptomyces sp. NPDC007025]|uniref:hypothetical protein n=1 Tax=Streptomyces sp. NPDC007025 TaxID=3364771 RepID=UPI0036CF14DB